MALGLSSERLSLGGPDTVQASTTSPCPSQSGLERLTIADRLRIPSVSITLPSIASFIIIVVLHTAIASLSVSRHFYARLCERLQAQPRL
eukprot:gene11285-18917_t